MHEHSWRFIVAHDQGSNSVDTYSDCRCGAVQHVYTWQPPGQESAWVRHENVFDPEAGDRSEWTSGYASGLRQVLHGVARERCTLTCPHGDRCVLFADHVTQYFHPGGVPVGCSHRKCFCNEPNTPWEYTTTGKPRE